VGPLDRSATREDGQTTTEYLGILVLVGLVIVALAATGIAGRIADGVSRAVCSIAMIESCAESELAGPADGTAARIDALVAAETARAAGSPARGAGWPSWRSRPAAHAWPEISMRPSG
jgi:Flp pilus assembly pilin Flp